jgi:predicted nuclease of predicted toxin-antitoxin system
LKFLLDVNIGRTVANALTDDGHDVARAALLYPTWEDRRLLALAVTEGRVVISQDSDFTDLIFAHAAVPPPGLIYLRSEPQNQPAMAAQILGVVNDERLIGHIAVVTETQTRFRPFPVRAAATIG